MKPALTSIPALTAAALCCVAGFSSHGRQTEWDKTADARKAAFMLMEASAPGDDDNSFAGLNERIFQLDSTLKIASYNYGYDRIMTATDSAQIEDGLDLMGRYVYSDESSASVVYGYAAACQYYGDTLRSNNTWDYLHRRFADEPEWWQRHAVSLYQMRDTTQFDRILALLDSALAHHGDPFDVAASQLPILLLKRDTLGAVCLTEGLKADFPLNPYAYSLASNVGDAVGDSAMCLDNLLTAIRLDPDNGNFLNRLADIYLEQGDSAAYGTTMRSAMLTADLDEETRLSLLREYASAVYDNKEMQPSTDSIFAAALEMMPYDKDLQLLHVGYLMATDRNAECELPLRTIIDADPTDLASWGALIASYARQDDYAGAMKTVDEGLTLMPDSSYFKLTRTRILMTMDRDSEALTYADSLLQTLGVPAGCEMTDSIPVSLTDPDFATDLLLLTTQIYQQLDDMTGAYKVFDYLLARNPYDPLVLNNYAWALAEHGGDLEKAEDMSFRSLQYDGRNATNLDTYAWIQFKLRNYDKARDYIDMAIQDAFNDSDTSNDTMAELLSHAGDIYFWVQEPEKAVQFWEAALELDPDDELLQKKVEHRTYFHQ